MKPTVLGIVIVIALIAAGAIFYAGSSFTSQPPQPVSALYSNGVYGISFTYPTTYLLSEESRGASHHITLIREEDAVPVVGGGEGPISITIDIYPLPAGLSLDAWVRGAPESNFALGPGTYDTVTLPGVEGVRYLWSGLYEGETVAFIHQEHVYALSVTFMSPADQIRIDFDTLLESLRVR